MFKGAITHGRTLTPRSLMIAIASLLFAASLGVSAPARPVSPVPACVVDTVWKLADPSDAAIARRVPSYAGSSADSALIATIYVTDLSDRDAAERAVKEELLRRFGMQVSSEARVERVKYSYRQLQSWLECLVSSARSGDIRGGGIETPRNRLTLQVADAKAQARLNALLRQRSIPAQAVRLQLAGSPHH